MKIEQSNVSLFSSHKKHSEIYESQTLHKWDSEDEAPVRLRALDRLELSRDFVSLKQSKEVQRFEESLDEASIDPKLMSIIRALEALLGKKIDLSLFKKLQGSPTQSGLQASQEGESAKEAVPQRVGWGIDYAYERSEIHEESLQFSAKGSVKTEGGKSLDFSLALSMQSRSESYENFSFKAGDALIDPLVLNFGAQTLSIGNIKHSFDLDLDGKSDTFSFVGSGSGFLVLDKNNDRIINNGSELFGPNNGNGFKELAAYDEDKNNWIDENDAIFKHLLIWTKDEQGVENLFSLGEKNVGAMYLGAIGSEFSLKDGGQSLQGLMRESSVYLKEDGGVGTLQEVDLKI